MVQIALVTALLARTDLFGALGDTDRRAIAEQMRETAYEPGQLIFAQGDAGDRIFLVVEGRVRLSVLSIDGRVLSFSHASTGNIFGEIAALDGGGRTADATALTHVRTAALARAHLGRLVETKPMVAQAAIAFLCARLRATSGQAEAIALHPIEVRLARFLLSAVRIATGSKVGLARAELDLAMSQAELALLLGASRQKVNAALAVLKEAGAINRVRGRIACDMDELKRIAGS